MTSWPVQTCLAGSVTSPPPTSPKELSQPGTGSAPAVQTGPGVFLSSDSDLGCKAVFQTTLTAAVIQPMPSSPMNVYPYGRDQRNEETHSLS